MMNVTNLQNQDDFIWLMKKLKSPISIKVRCLCSRKLLKEEIQMKTFEKWSSKFKICFTAQMDGNHFCWKKECLLLFCFENENMKIMLSFERNTYSITTISKFSMDITYQAILKHNLWRNLQEDFAQFSFIMVQLKVSKFKIKLIQTLELSLFWRQWRLLLFQKTAHHKENLIWIDDEMEIIRYSRTIHHW